MKRITKRRFLDVALYVATLVPVAYINPWAFVLAWLYALWAFYDGATRHKLED